MKAVKITRQSLANDAARRWRATYFNSKYGDDKLRIGAELLALGENPSPDAVDSTIGNTSWTSVPSCDGCEADDLPAVVMVGQEEDYKSRTAHLCEACLNDALRVLTEREAG